ncbi:MAG: SusC/RagA family TonB-linked outer membrane protein [Bacilli bacterium]
MLQVSAEVNAQKGKLDVKVKDVALSELLWQLQENSKIVFIYKTDDLKDIRKVSINLKNTTISRIMSIALVGTNLTYSIENNVVVIKKKTDAQQTQQERHLITGKIIDKSKRPLPGVTVRVKGTIIGTSTNMDGEYKIKVPENSILVFSMVGMKTVEELTKDKKVIDVLLEEDVAKLDDVVVNGYFSRSKDNFTGNAVIIDREDLKKVSSNNLITALQIFDPSFRIKENVDMGSNPNNLPDFRIRGNSGFGSEALSESNLKNNPNLPTFILDGYEVRVEKIFDLDMDRIKSVTILKDASATAIYGSRAANGIVVITTKTPKEGEIRVSYNARFSVEAPDLSDYNLLNAEEKLQVEKDAGLYEDDDLPTKQKSLKDYNNRLRNIRKGVNTYWLSKPLRVPCGQTHSLYLEGGDKSARYGVDASYNLSPGIMKKSSRNRFALGFLLSYNLNDKLLFKNKLTINKVKSKDSPYGDFSDYAKANPYNPIYNDHGDIIKIFRTNVPTSLRFPNPLYEASLNNRSGSEYTEWTDNFNFDWFINNNFRFKASLSYSEKNTTKETFTDPKSARYNNSKYEGDGLLKKGRAYKYDEKSSNLDLNVVFSYKKSFGKHFINTVIGTNIIESNYSNESYSVIGFPSGNLDYISYANEFENKAPDGDEGKSRLAGAFLNVNYSMNNLYLLDLSIRMDGSSKFGSKKRYAPFWSMGVSWNLHNEQFVKEIEFINRLKISANLGELGKASFSPYEAQNVYEFYKNQSYTSGLGACLMALGNEDLKWEKTRTTDINFEIEFLKGLFALKASYYLKKTNDLLSDITLPLSNGFRTYKDNMGSLENKGYELNLRGFVFRNENVILSLFGTLAHNKNTIKKIANSLQSYNDKVDYDQNNNDVERVNGQIVTSKPKIQFKEGQSTTAIYAVKSLGINPINGKEVFVDRNGNITYDWNALDKIVCGDTEPDFSGALGLNADYKGFNLNMSFMYKFGGQVYNQTLVDRVENANLNWNVDHRVYKGRWRNPGDRTFFKDIKDNTRTEVSTRFVEDENVLQFQSLSFSYTFPKNIIKKLSLERLKLTFLMEDVFRFSSVKRERGLSYPFARTFNFGVQIQF